MQSIDNMPFRLWMLLCLLAFPVAASAGNESAAGQDYVIKVWGADDGLTEGSVTDVTQTPEGFLWVGTLFGSVLRFDGSRFASYNSANTPEFSLKWGVPRLKVAQGGTLWITMLDGGITTWDQEGFRSVFASTNQPDNMLWSAPGKVVFAYGEGRLLCGQKPMDEWHWRIVNLTNAMPQSQHCADAGGRGGVLRNENEIGIWDEQETQTIAPQTGLEGQKIKVLTADSQGRIWIGTDKSLAVWETNHFEVMTPTNGEAHINVKKIIPSGGTNLWIEANGKLRRCADRQWLAESAGWEREMIANKVSIRFIHGDSQGGLWSGAGDLGLMHVSPDGDFDRLTVRDGLPSNTIGFVYEDHDGDLWTGYERGGLVQIRRRQFRHIGKEEGLRDSIINTVSEDDKGAVWIGTHSGIVGRYENGVCTNINLPGQSRIQDSCVAADRNGRVWMGAQGTGLLLYEAGQSREIATQAQLQGYPRLLMPGRDGRLWVGTLWSIICVTNETLQFEYTAKTVGEHPTALAEAADGTIWAGTLAGSLLRWDGTQFVRLDPPGNSSLGRIWALSPGSDGGLWAGTEQGGLLHLKNGKFYRYTMKDGLPSDSISQLLSDAEGNLWLGTRAGIARVLKGALDRFERGEMDELPVSVYGLPDGLLTIGGAIIDQPNCWQGKDGKLFFAMANSVAEVDPAQIHLNPIPPAVALEEMWADGKRVWPHRAGAILTATGSFEKDSGQPSAQPITVGPGRGDLEFHYTGLSLGSPLLIRFKYKLEGLESKWNEAGTERKAIYRHVPPGDYVFCVMACNSDRVCSRECDLLTVKCNPYFYQTVWFQGGAGLALFLATSFAVALAIRRRMHRHVEQLERQHELERERSRIAQDLHDDLGAGLTEIGLLGGLLQDPSGFSARKQDALKRIVGRCHDLVVALDEIVWAVNPKNDSVKSLAGYLSRYAQGFLEPTRIRCRLEILESEADHPLNSEQRHNLFLAFKESLTNVVKHSGATEVHIKFSSADNNPLSICVQDNGCGLPAEMKKPEEADGLQNLKRRMEQIGGKCEITSRDGAGVVVTLSLSLAALHKNVSSARAWRHN